MQLVIQKKETMDATLSLNYTQVLNLLMQLPVRTQLRLGKALTQNSTEIELRHFLDTFKTDELTEEDILSEVKAVRQQRYARKNV